MGKSGTTKYPKMFNLPSPFNMESKRLNKLKKKGDKVAKNILKSLTKWIWVRNTTRKKKLD